MSALKSGLIGAAAVGGVIALLFASGTVTLRGSDDDGQAEDGGDEPGAQAGAGKDKKGKRHRKRRRKGGRRGKKGSKDNLDSLGYIASSRDVRHEGKQGLTINTADKRADGFVLFNYCGWGPGLKSAALTENYGDTILLSNDGKEVHRWHSDSFGPQKHGRSVTRLLPNGDILINVADLGIARMNWAGETLWKLEDVFHHDLQAGPDGSIWALVERKLELPDSEIGKVLDHGLQHISADGVVLTTLWLSDVFAESELYTNKIDQKRKRRGRGDVFHLNSVQVVTQPGPNDLWKAGDLLISPRNFNTIAVIDSESGEVRWTWGAGELQHQHSPSMTADNRVLVFDNGNKRKWSRALEVAPETGEVTWQYKGTEADPFYSDTRGIVQDLPGGNVFVISSNSGRIFEVTREGEIVWEYWTGEQHGSKVVPIRGMHVHGDLAKVVEERLGAASDGDAAKPADAAEPAADGEAAGKEAPAKSDAPEGDAGKGDAGKGDAGKGDAGKGDAGKGDAGKGDAAPAE